MIIEGSKEAVRAKNYIAENASYETSLLLWIYVNAIVQQGFERMWRQKIGPHIL